MRQECNKHVQVYLGLEEKAEFARQLARNTADLETLTDRKKQMSSEFKAKIDAANAEIFKIARLLNNGYEYRDVKCDIQFDLPRRGFKRIIRMDTGEVLEEIPMSADELQQSLDFRTEQDIESAHAPEAAVEEPAPEQEPAPQPEQAVEPEIIPPVEEMPRAISEPQKLTGSGDGWKAEILIFETAAGFETEVVMEIGADEPLAVDGGKICSAESEAREDAAHRLYLAAQRCYAEANGRKKRTIREVMGWTQEYLPKNGAVGSAE